MEWNRCEGKSELLPGLAQEKRERNIRYLLELKTEHLLFPFYWQAGLTGSINRRMPELHGGWDAQTSHIRGTFTGHWLSAAAFTWDETGNRELRARAEYVVEELRRCQKANGGGWVFPIPPEYITRTRDNTHSYWAPLYVCHKVLMGLLDMHLVCASSLALLMVEEAAAWFTAFLQESPRELLNEMMGRQETGGLMELWADLYAVTGKEEHLSLLQGFERPGLFEPLLQGKDVLTNMHANSTIPEIHGAARAYEVTGDERYRRITQAYWDWAVTKRGMFATGGQTAGEVWTPPQRQAARLGDSNQEHCVVYNMIRLADYLFRWTGESGYLDYIERNIYNGIYAQGHWEEAPEGALSPRPDLKRGYVAYYLPLRAGAQKKWGSAADHFWCCHCTLVQAHSRLRQFALYRKGSRLVVGQYLPSRWQLTLPTGKLEVAVTETDLGGSCNEVNQTALEGLERPSCQAWTIRLKGQEPVEAGISLHIPWWVQGTPSCAVDGKPVEAKVEQGFLTLEGSWQDEEITLVLPKALTAWPLPDEPETVAFLDGPVVLAGLVGEERMLYGELTDPAGFIKPGNERIWGAWTQEYKTFGQPAGFRLIPLYQVGEERYTVYFPVRPKGYWRG